MPIKPAIACRSVLLFMCLIIGLPLMTAQTVTYTESTEDFTNPDRGFYTYSETKASSYTPLSLNTLLANQANGYTSDEANYTVKPSLVFRYFVLDDFYQGTDITPTFLNKLQADFDIARQAGVRLIIRFTYNINPDTSCGESACPPYFDANKNTILNHIAQLKPYLQANPDVIATVQMGFIGVWGEQYYSSYFGDTSDNADDRYSNQNWIDRNAVLASVLDATPNNRMVQVRYPQLKQRFLGGPTAPVSTNAITAGQAHQETDIARIGFHNDCFLSDDDDFGTYFDYGNDASFPSNQIDVLKPYFANDSKFVAVGGETCGDGFNPQNNCGGQVLSDMADLHYSYLNTDFNNEVNNDWQTGGCMEEIKRKLGYRLVMKNGTYPSMQAAGTTLNFTLTIENIGFAAPFNYRELFLIIRPTGGGTATKLPISGTNSDTRFWHTGMINLAGTVQLPSNMPQGNYDLLLHIADTSNGNSVRNRPEYSIRLANNNTWESSTGYNNLNHTLSITNNTPTTECIEVDGNFSDWANFAAISTNGTGGLTALKANDDNENLYLYAGTSIDANYQFYLDTDNTTSGFTNSFWENTGFNYLVENGLLYEYTGTGSDFTWTDIGEVAAEKTASGVEISIAKSRLNGINTTIKIGFGNLNANWNETGEIPNANTASTYNMSATDCSCNAENLTLSGLLNTSKTYETDGTITSTEMISGNGSVVYDAGTSIILKNGFSVRNGIDFHAYIEGCEAPNIRTVFEEVSNLKTLETALAKERLALTDLPTNQAVHSLSNNISNLKDRIEMLVFPNPVQQEAAIKLKLPIDTSIDLALTNQNGQLVRRYLQDDYKTVGEHYYKLDATTLPSGIYFLQLRSVEGVVTQKLVVQR